MKNHFSLLIIIWKLFNSQTVGHLRQAMRSSMIAAKKNCGNESQADELDCTVKYFNLMHVAIAMAAGVINGE